MSDEKTGMDVMDAMRLMKAAPRLAAVLNKLVHSMGRLDSTTGPVVIFATPADIVEAYEALKEAGALKEPEAKP
jgi:hypothetical protein